ncbi:MAG: cytochrome c3 family protein [Prolixibacteraceae bacterium]|nr:cytochrome c3 family protein [Prolixibacteraceae bacterium]
MKFNHIIHTTGFAVMILLSSFLFTGCTKEGPQGLPGLDGEDGKDGAQTCSECHNMSEFLVARIEQYNHSTHATGANTNRSTAGCARCHTSMGFRNFIIDSTDVNVDNPTPINCRTCHPIHETFTSDDFALRTTDSITLMNGDIYNYGQSNLCVNCHQARPISPYPDLSSSEKVTISSIHYGPHHAPQANMFMSTGPVEIKGSMPYLNSAHTKMVYNGCVTCHMSPATGVLGGGHQMGVKYTTVSGSEAYQYTGCFTADCHGTVSEINGMIVPNRAEITALIEELNSKLMAKGFFDDHGHLIAPLTLTQKEAAVILNYLFVVEDKSFGAHNFRYTKALLTNSIEALQ